MADHNNNSLTKTTDSSSSPPLKRGKWATTTNNKDDDHLSELPEELLCRVTSFLNAPSLYELQCVNPHYHEICSKPTAGWELLCQQLWKTKIHVSSRQDPNRLRAYLSSIRDSHRNYVLPEEFCYDANLDKGTIWSFRFKESAGSDWTSVDPWFQGEPCRKFVFLRDGTVQQYVVNNNGTTNDSAAPLQNPTFGRRQQQQQQQANSNNNNRVLMDPPVTMTWRFLTRPLDLPTRPWGSYVRFSVGGRDVPTYAVRRSPTGNWGFVMENCWGIYASFELPPRRRRQFVEGTSVWIPEFNSNNNSSDHEEENVGERQLVDDSLMQVTNEIQWREAFLYNVGARVLPEGDQATDDFDLAWRGLHQRND